MDLISYEQYQFDWAKDYLLEGSLESVQTDLGTGLIVYNSQNTIQIGDTVSLNTNGQSKEIQIVGMLSDCPFYSAAGVGQLFVQRIHLNKLLASRNIRLLMCS